MAKSNPDLSEELALYQAGYRCVVGVDEAGRGAWAGPLVAGAVVLPVNSAQPLTQALLELTHLFAGVNDSKQLTPSRRESLFETITAHAYCGVGIVSALAIDIAGVGVANRLAWKRAIADLPSDIQPDFLLLDAFKLPELPLPQRAIIKGDTISLSIAAASIVAKVTRDRLLTQLEAVYPGYRFEAHKGYGTTLHSAALTKNGPCAEHRYSYRPVWRAYCRALPPELFQEVAFEETAHA